MNETTAVDASVAERVRRGATLLDEVRPGWAVEIAPECLNIKSCNECVLGQIYGVYGVGLKLIGLPLSRAQEFGFDDTNGEVSDVAAAWRAEVRARTGEATHAG